jgi:two-component system, sensor histidine kinase
MAKANNIANGIKILIAEDNVINRSVLMKQLQVLGYEVQGVVNGQEAVVFCQNHEVDCILMDCQMPIMSGYEAAFLIRQQEINVVIIGLTANALPGDREKCLDAGMDDYLAKPVFVKDLKETLDKWLTKEEVN